MTAHIEPSQTALFAAAARAAHAHVDAEPHILIDEVAERLCRAQGHSPLDYQLAHPEAAVLAAARLSACARSRYAEAVLSKMGADQIVVVGAGLDTIGHRRPQPRPDQVWLVDRAGVLAWRAQLFDEAGLADEARYVSADLEDGFDLRGLEAAGLELSRPVSVVWLGVSMYLTPDLCRRFFAELADLAEGSSLVFDYHVAPELRDDAGREFADAVAAVAGRGGEPWRCSASSELVTGWLADNGWRVEDEIDEAMVTSAGFFDQQEFLSPMRLVRLVHARNQR